MTANGDADARESITDEDVLATLRELYESGRRDDLGGGVHPYRVADALEAAPRDIYRRLAELERAGAVESVQGVSPDSREPRTSYVPAEYVENPR